VSAYKTMIRNKSEAITFTGGARTQIDGANDPETDDAVTMYGYVQSEAIDPEGYYTINPIIPFSEVADSSASNELMAYSWLTYDDRLYEVRNVEKFKQQGDFFYKLIAVRE